MRIKNRWIFLVILAVLVLFVTFYALAASNTVPNTSLGLYVTPLSTGDVLPIECQGMNIDGNKNGLFLGTTGVDNLNGGNGNDCIVGGGGNDTIYGGPGNDVLIGGNGNDSLDGGPGTDVCYGGCGTNTFARCETIVNTCP
jgi:Ca2+-binding RTX toxin-like protein